MKIMHNNFADANPFFVVLLGDGIQLELSESRGGYLLITKRVGGTPSPILVEPVASDCVEVG